MDMFQSFLSSIPSNRSEMVNDLELPEDLSLSSYVWTEPEELDVRSEESSSPISLDEELRRGSINTASSMALSRAMTDSEIDYGRARRYKTRSFSEPWDQMKAALDAFPPDYLSSLHSFQTTSDETAESAPLERMRPLHNEELLLKMQRFFDDECTVFAPDDEGLLDLEEALQNVDLRSLDSDFSVTP